MTEYLEREAVRKALYEADEITFDGLDIIDNFPAADVQPVKHGRWSGYFCSNCGISKYNFISFDFDDQNGYARPFGTWLYCPRCGARMDGET